MNSSFAGWVWGVYYSSFLSVILFSLLYLMNTILMCGPACYFMMHVTSCCRNQRWSSWNVVSDHAGRNIWIQQKVADGPRICAEENAGLTPSFFPWKKNPKQTKHQKAATKSERKVDGLASFQDSVCKNDKLYKICVTWVKPGTGSNCIQALLDTWGGPKDVLEAWMREWEDQTASRGLHPCPPNLIRPDRHTLSPYSGFNVWAASVIKVKSNSKSVGLLQN